MADVVSPPIYDEVAVVEDPLQNKKIPRLIAGFRWLRYFLDLQALVDKAPTREAHVALTTQAASIGVTAIPIGSVTAGLYRVSYVFRITRAGSVSSTLTFTLSWTEGGIAMTTSGAAATGNTTATGQRGTLPIRVDANTAISYSTTYGDGGGAVAMQYRLDVVLEALALDAA